MKLTIYHNTRCRKSREALELLESKGLKPDIIEYLKNPLSEKQIEELILLLNLDPMQLVRVNEALWKEQYRGKNFSKSEIIALLTKHPKLIERPIISSSTNAVIGRPIDQLIHFLESH